MDDHILYFWGNSVFFFQYYIGIGGCHSNQNEADIHSGKKRFMSLKKL